MEGIIRQIKNKKEEKYVNMRIKWNNVILESRQWGGHLLGFLFLSLLPEWRRRRGKRWDLAWRERREILKRAGRRKNAKRNRDGRK